MLLLSADTIMFYTDPVVYKTSIELEDTITRKIRAEALFYVEFNCEIPYQELHYQSAENIVFANATMPFKIVDLFQPDSLIDTIYRQFTIPSFSYAAKQRISYLVQFGAFLPEGEFRYRVEILSGEKEGTQEAVLVIRKDDYAMSDILLSSEITFDTLGDYLRKGDLRIIPRPSHTFDERFKNLCFYYELYDAPHDLDTLRATYEIVDGESNVVRRISRPIEKIFPAQAVNCGISIEGVASGNYRLSVRIEDRDSNMVAQKETPFSIERARRLAVSYEGMPYYTEIKYFLSSRDYKTFEKLSDEGRKIFLDRFWQTHDYNTIAARFEYADEKYRHGNTAGHNTDRGRVYVKYGEPDEIDLPTPLEHQESRPYEHWQYPNGVQFIFVDIRGANEYVLIWTNAMDEQKQPTMYQYLPEEKLNLVQ
jgi:GWxTD domain-containing protein